MSSSPSEPTSLPSDPERLADEIARTAAHLDAATHRLLTCIRKFDESGEWHRQGALSCAHWLTWRISLDPNTEHLENGMVRLSVVLHPDEAAVVTRAIEEARRASQEGKPAGTAEPSVSAETPSPHRLIPAPDALVQIAESYLAHGDATHPAADRTQIVVHLEQDALAPDGTLCASLDDGRRVSSETFRRIACDSSLVAMFHGPGGQVLQAGRRTRTVSPALLRALRTRDGGCRFPGCENRLYIHAHHIEHWAHGGETSLENLALLCSTHHRLVHEGGFGIATGADGALTFSDPQGRPISSAPKSASIEGEPLDLLSSWNRQAGALLEEEIPYPQWDGTPLDYHEAVAAALRP